MTTETIEVTIVQNQGDSNRSNVPNRQNYGSSTPPQRKSYQNRQRSFKWQKGQRSLSSYDHPTIANTEQNSTILHIVAQPCSSQVLSTSPSSTSNTPLTAPQQIEQEAKKDTEVKSEKEKDIAKEKGISCSTEQETKTSSTQIEEKESDQNVNKQQTQLLTSSPSNRPAGPNTNEHSVSSNGEQGATDRDGKDSNDDHGKDKDKRKKHNFTPNTYKTEVCRTFMATGKCEYEWRCQFAHGVSELRARDFDVKYKTKRCKNYHSTGFCRFSSRCKFIHDEYRVQVSEVEFWLISPSDKLVRVEIAADPLRRNQLTNLVRKQTPSSQPSPLPLPPAGPGLQPQPPELGYTFHQETHD
jgi:tristetraprolin/butyrate response factor 1